VAAIVLEHLTKIHSDGTRALDDFSLDIKDGELLVIVGPSGCGKTTALRLIAGLDDPTSGSISVGGRIINDLLPKDRDMAMVFQNYALYPNMDAHDNIGFGLKMRKRPKDYAERKIRRATEMVEFMELLTAMPAAMSGGEQQKVAVGRAVVRNPAAFLFDEPLGMLDAATRTRLRPKLKIMHTLMKTTTIHVTHDQIEAMGLGDRICVMREGRMMQVGTPMELYDCPANTFVAGFLGSPPMNLIDGEILVKDGALCFISKSLEFKLPQEWNGKFEAGNDRKVKMGVRSECIHAGSRTDAAEYVEINGVVELVEPFGSASHIHISTPDGTITAIADVHSGIRIGDSARAFISVEKIHFFDRATGTRL